MTRPTIADLEGLARGAGEILLSGFDQVHEIKYKGVIDPVTEMDHASEAYILGEIRRRWPNASILTEESGAFHGSDNSHWYIDPLDGTVNYAHGIPVFAVSIGYAEEGVTRLGVVFDPIRGEMFSGERGQGATLNGSSLHASKETVLQRSLLVTGFPYDAWDTDQDNFNNFVRLGKLSQGVRRLGSAALDGCYVAAGRFEGFWEMSLRPWDVAAAGLIAEEAGAKVTNVRNEPDYLSEPQSIVAAAPAIHGQILANLTVSQR